MCRARRAFPGRRWPSFVAGWLAEHAQGEVAGHQGARRAHEQIVKGAAEGAHASERAHAHGDRQDHEEKLGGRRAHVAPGDFESGWWITLYTADLRSGEETSS